MKLLFFKIFKILLLVTLVVFVFLLIAGGLIWAGWPLWIIFFIAAGILGIILGVLLIKKLMARKQEQRFVQQIIFQDDASLSRMGKQEQNATKEMQKKWKEAMDALKRSHLKSRGNPLYVLPWYMVIGTSGSGKTTAIKSARLTSSFEDAEAISGLSGTKNCDWWFFEQAIIIDTAGRYAVPVDETRDRDEWQRFLSLLARYRKKEPLNGLIVTIPADTINTMNMEAIDGYAKGIRMRIDEIMRVLGSKFPVYTMVTKCDLIQGMTRFCDHLPEDSLKQVMGEINSEPDQNPATVTSQRFESMITVYNKDTSDLYPGTVVAQCFESMGQRIRDIILLILESQLGKTKDPELLLFPKEFGKLRPGLERFITRVFQKTPYQETPLFRGIFFTSGRQEGTPFSHFLKDLGLISEQQMLPGTSKGLFLHNFFASLLPGDRGLFTLTAKGAQWLRLTKSLGFASFIAIVIAFCGLLSFSFVKNLNTLKQVTSEFATPGILQGELLADTIALERFNNSILDVEKQNKNWWIPRFGLTESLKVEIGLKEKYCKLVRSRFIDPFDKKRADAMAYTSGSTDNQARIDHMVHLARRINLIRARLSGETIEDLSSLPQPDYRGIDLNIGQAIVDEVRQKLKHLYLYTLVWRTDTQELNMEMNDLQKWLVRLLTLEGTTMNWLVAWANSEPDLSAYTMDAFWGGNPLKDEKIINIMPAYTLKGQESINSLVKEMEDALTDPLVIASKKRDFIAWYTANYLNAWHDFLKAFPSGKNRLSTKSQWKIIAETIHKPDSPFQMILTTATRELEPFLTIKESPQWVGLLGELARVETQATLIKAREMGNTGLIKTATDRLKSKLSVGNTQTLGTGPASETIMTAGKALLDYGRALDALAPMASSTKSAFNAATALYKDDPSTNQSPFFKGQTGVATLRKSVDRSFEGAQEIWVLISGPLDLFQEFLLKESACELQKIWEKTVLVELSGQDGASMENLVMGDKGLATRFIEGDAAPFLERDLKKGFHAIKINDKGVDFSSSFLTFLTRGKVAVTPSQKEYAVKISGSPTNANDDALFQPNATILTLECEGSTTTLENFNYPVKEVFHWSLEKNCDIVLKIKVSNLVLEKRYNGVHGFPKFLRDFDSGSKTFYPENFPDQKSALKRMKIDYIRVKYQFKDQEPVVRLLAASPGKVPMEIAPCWD